MTRLAFRGKRGAITEHEDVPGLDSTSSSGDNEESMLSPKPAVSKNGWLLVKPTVSRVPLVPPLRMDSLSMSDHALVAPDTDSDAQSAEMNTPHEVSDPPPTPRTRSLDVVGRWWYYVYFFAMIGVILLLGEIKKMQ